MLTQIYGLFLFGVFSVDHTDVIFREYVTQPVRGVAMGQTREALAGGLKHIILFVALEELKVLHTSGGQHSYKLLIRMNAKN